MPQVRTSIGKDFQDVTLDRLITRGMVTTIYLRNRMSLRGRVRDFDPYVLLLEPLDGTPIQLVYKSAIVSISGPPRRPMGPPRRGPGGPRPPRGPGYGGGPGYGPRREGPGGYGPPREGPGDYGPSDRGPRPEPGQERPPMPDAPREG